MAHTETPLSQISMDLSAAFQAGAAKPHPGTHHLRSFPCHGAAEPGLGASEKHSGLQMFAKCFQGGAAFMES